MKCITVNLSFICTPQAFLPWKKRNLGGLADIQLFLCQKLHFWRACVQHVGLLLCYPAKNAGKKKPHKLLHCLGQTPWGNPSRADGDADREQTKERSELSGYPAVPEPNGWERALRIRAAANAWVSVSMIYPGTCLPGYQCTQLQHAAMSIKPEAFVFHICICLPWQATEAVKRSFNQIPNKRYTPLGTNIADVYYVECSYMKSVFCYGCLPCTMHRDLNLLIVTAHKYLAVKDHNAMTWLHSYCIDQHVNPVWELKPFSGIANPHPPACPTSPALEELWSYRQTRVAVAVNWTVQAATCSLSPGSLKVFTAKSVDVRNLTWWVVSAAHNKPMGQIYG